MIDYMHLQIARFMKISGEFSKIAELVSSGLNVFQCSKKEVGATRGFY